MAVAILGAVGAAAAGQAMTVVSVIIGQTIAAGFSPVSRGMTHAANWVIRNETMGIGDAIEAMYRGDMTSDAFRNELRIQGLNSDRIDIIESIAHAMLNIMDNVTLYRRGHISKDVLVEEGSKIKWTEDKIDRLLDITEVRPSATDIIAFAVREVYSPEIAEAFGQFEGTDEVYEKAKLDIEATGMTKETFSKYWAAHWMLPSVQQGYEMMHRRVIPAMSTPEQPLSLDRLMVALDIMPAWREPLTKISYNPYTRVDVRRMHKLGILSDDDLLSAYLDLGYDSEKAQGMVEFTLAYNAEPEASEETEKDKDKAKERDLTKSDVLYGYRSHLLSEAETLSSLYTLGYDSDEAAFYISKENFARDKDEDDAYLKYYHDAYVKGVLDYNTVKDKLGELNLTDERMTFLLNRWELDKMARVNKPTKAELLTFLRKKIIDQTTFVTEMMGDGYSQRYIDWYLQTV